MVIDVVAARDGASWRCHTQPMGSGAETPRQTRRERCAAWNRFTPSGGCGFALMSPPAKRLGCHHLHQAHR